MVQGHRDVPLGSDSWSFHHRDSRDGPLTSGTDTPPSLTPLPGTLPRWASLRWFERRTIETETVPPARAPMWWRPDGRVPDDPVLTASLVAYMSAVTLTEPAFAARGGVGASAQRDHSVWFHGRAVLSDWLFYDRSSPSSAGSLALASGTMFNRTGELVCTVKQEMYFPPQTA
nr:acyl-CoA thioesterase domain-containing protein [Mycobacterium avium]